MKLKNNIVSYFILFSLMVGCSATSNHKILSYFIDGIPPPTVDLEVGVSDTLVVSLNDSTITVNSAISNIRGSIHPPYLEKKCFLCHQQTRVSTKNTTLCINCHDSFNTEQAFEHGPAVSGNCTQCHSPHESENTKLLKRTGQALCLNCHEERVILTNKIHSTISDQNCVECHNPHGGNQRAFLQKDSCFKCHNDFPTDKTFLHGPVDANRCAVCHESHDSGSKQLLVLPGNQLCLNCHGANVTSVVYHENKDNQDCVTCHNPHSANNKFLLIKSNF